MRIFDTCRCGARFETESRIGGDVMRAWTAWVNVHAVCRGDDREMIYGREEYQRRLNERESPRRLTDREVQERARRSWPIHQTTQVKSRTRLKPISSQPAFEDVRKES